MSHVLVANNLTTGVIVLSESLAVTVNIFNISIK